MPPLDSLWKPSELVTLSDLAAHHGTDWNAIATAFFETHPDSQRTVDAVKVKARRMRGVSGKGGSVDGGQGHRPITSSTARLSSSGLQSGDSQVHFDSLGLLHDLDPVVRSQATTSSSAGAPKPVARRVTTLPQAKAKPIPKKTTRARRTPKTTSTAAGARQRPKRSSKPTTSKSPTTRPSTRSGQSADADADMDTDDELDSNLDGFEEPDKPPKRLIYGLAKAAEGLNKAAGFFFKAE